MQILVAFRLFRSFLPAIWLTGSFYVAPALMPCYIYLLFQRAWKIIGTFITPLPWNIICHVVKVYPRYHVKFLSATNTVKLWNLSRLTGLCTHCWVWIHWHLTGFRQRKFYQKVLQLFSLHYWIQLKLISKYTIN